MPDGNLCSHHVEQIIEISTMHHVRKHLAVHLFHLRPIRAVHIRHVEIVAFVAPAFVEDLFELFPWVEIHPQRSVQTALPRLWRIAISVNDKERRNRWHPTRGTLTAAPAAAAASTAIEEFVTICAHFVS